MSRVAIDMEWIPPASLRGNSRQNRHQRARLNREVRDKFQQYAEEMLNDGEIEPLKDTDLHLEIVVWTARSIDLDNMLIGYKPVMDGLQKAGVLVDDKRIASIHISRRPPPDAPNNINKNRTRLILEER